MGGHAVGGGATACYDGHAVTQTGTGRDGEIGTQRDLAWAGGCRALDPGAGKQDRRGPAVPRTARVRRAGHDPAAGVDDSSGEADVAHRDGDAGYDGQHIDEVCGHRGPLGQDDGREPELAGRHKALGRRDDQIGAGQAAGGHVGAQTGLREHAGRSHERGAAEHGDGDGDQGGAAPAGHPQGEDQHDSALPGADQGDELLREFGGRGCRQPVDDAAIGHDEDLVSASGCRRVVSDHDNGLTKVFDEVA
jgi:hypothetical protein